MSTILQICQDVASLVAVQKPSNLFNASSQQESIFLSIANDTLESLRRYGDWQELTKEGHFTTIPGKSLYTFDEVCPDFYSLINNTIYVLNTAQQLIGSITPEQWMKDRFFHSSDNDIKFKIQSNGFKFLTPPTKEVEIVYNYRSSVVAYDYNEACFDYGEKTSITNNTDVPIFDAYLVKLGILWRWYKRSGMPYQEEYVEYASEIKKKFGASLATHDINLANQGGLHAIRINNQ